MLQHRFLQRRVKDSHIEGVAEALITGGDAEIEAYIESRIRQLMNPIRMVKPGRTFTYTNAYPAAIAAAAALAANTQYAVPLGHLVGSVDQASINITTAGAASTVLRLAIVAFADDPAGIYTVEVVTDAGTVDVSSTGIKTWTLDETFDGTREIGYFLWGNGTPSARHFTPYETQFGHDDAATAANYGFLYKTPVTYSSSALAATYTLDQEPITAPRVDFRVA